MPTKTLTLEDLHQQAKGVRALFTKYSKFGAEDTEPEANLRQAIRQSVKAGEVKLPRDWELYDDEDCPGSKEAAAHINGAVEEMLNTLLSMKLGEINEAKRVMTKWFFVDWNYRD